MQKRVTIEPSAPYANYLFRYDIMDYTTVFFPIQS